MTHATERREFFRTRCDVPVRFQFIAPHLRDAELAGHHEGVTNNLSGGGLLLQGTLPKLDWVPDLLMQKMAVGVTVLLPMDPSPVAALARVSWIETINERTRQCRLGLRFREITSQDRDRLFQFVIKGQLPG